MAAFAFRVCLLVPYLPLARTRPGAETGDIVACWSKGVAFSHTGGLSQPTHHSATPDDATGVAAQDCCYCSCSSSQRILLARAPCVPQLDSSTTKLALRSHRDDAARRPKSRNAPLPPPQLLGRTTSRLRRRRREPRRPRPNPVRTVTSGSLCQEEPPGYGGTGQVWFVT